MDAQSVQIRDEVVLGQGKLHKNVVMRLNQFCHAQLINRHIPQVRRPVLNLFGKEQLPLLWYCIT